MKMRRALVVFENRLSRCPRGARMRTCLERLGYGVSLASEEAGEGNLIFQSRGGGLRGSLVNQLNRYVGFTHWFWRRKQEQLFGEYLSNNSFEIISVHSIDLLETVLKFRGSAKVIFDAREYYPDQFSDRKYNRIFRIKKLHSICRDLLPKCDLVITVSQGLLDLYRTHYDIKAELVLSLPPYVEPGELYGSESKGPGYDPIRIIHHGNVARSRNLGNMLDALDLLGSRFELDLMLTRSSPRHYEEIVKRAELSANVRIIPAVEPDRIVSTLSGYDLGLIMFAPVNLNLRHCMPNKLFEMVQARLPVVSTPLPDISQFLTQNKVGFVAEDYGYEAVAETLNGLTRERISEAKMGLGRISKTYSLEANVENIGCLIETHFNL
jgi:glycosyltransferase involved in cell wall biosynthesis